MKFVGALLVGLAAAVSGARADERLASPYAAPPMSAPRSEPSVDCPTPPPPMRDLRIESVYQAPDFRTIVPERVVRRKAAVDPLHRYLAQAADLSSSALLATSAERPARIACLEAWLKPWAAGGALLGEIVWPEGNYERKWSMIALGLGYLQSHAGERTRAAPDWLVAWFQAASDDLASRYPADAPKKNNHWYWAGLLSVVAGTIANDHDRYAWGVGQYREALAAIDSEGYLPLELLRGEGALPYHAMSAGALVFIAAFEAANGRPLEGEAALRLRRLVDRVLEGYADPSSFERLAGAAQRPLDPSGIRAMAWLETYYALTADPAAEPWLRLFRPLRSLWFGGDVTAAFGRPLPPGPTAASPSIAPTSATSPPKRP